MGIIMENSLKLLGQAVSVLMFCTAISVFLLLYSNYQKEINISNSFLTESIAFEQYNDVKELNFTKGEILIMLIYKLEYDIEIDGLLISQYENVKENISNISIEDKEYFKSYGYDTNGNITRIIFTSMN
ncbi:MAG: hypothetical protein K0R21_1623, partial [Anaerocolumna sp.]|nr:hypothetical protein [Anaerocolumna sp.]